MSKTTKPFGTELDAEPQGRKPEPSNGVEQRDQDASVAAILARDEERQIQGVIFTTTSKNPWMMMPPKSKKTTSWTRTKQ